MKRMKYRQQPVFKLTALRESEVKVIKVLPLVGRGSFGSEPLVPEELQIGECVAHLKAGQSVESVVQIVSPEGVPLPVEGEIIWNDTLKVKRGF